MSAFRSNQDILRDILIDSSDSEESTTSKSSAPRQLGNLNIEENSTPKTPKQNQETSESDDPTSSPLATHRKIAVRQFVSPSTGSQSEDPSEPLGHREELSTAPASKISSVQEAPLDIQQDATGTVADLQNEELLTELEQRLAQRREIVEAQAVVVQSTPAFQRNQDVPYSEDEASDVSLDSSNEAETDASSANHPSVKDSLLLESARPNSYIPTPTPNPSNHGMAQDGPTPTSMGEKPVLSRPSVTAKPSKAHHGLPKPKRETPTAKSAVHITPLPDPRNLSGGPRMYAQALHQRKNLNKWVEQQKVEREEEEMVECSFAPRTAKPPTADPQSADLVPKSNRSAQLYVNERKMFIQKLSEREEANADQEKHLSFQPKLGSMSNEIVHKHRVKASSDTMPASERLYTESAHKKLSLQQRQEEHREGLLRAGGGKEQFASEEEAICFVERLYRLDRNRQLRLDRLRESIYKDEMQPDGSEQRKKQVNSWEVVSRLTGNKKSTEGEFQDPDLTFKPKIDAMSAHLAARVRNAKFRNWFSYFFSQGEARKLDDTQLESATITLDSHLNSFSGEEWFDFNGCGCPPAFEAVADCLRNQLPLFLTMDEFIDACDTAKIHPWKLEEPPFAKSAADPDLAANPGRERAQLLRHFPFSPPLSTGTKEITKNRSRNKENIHGSLYDQWKKNHDKVQAKEEKDRKARELATVAEQQRRDAYWKQKLSTRRPKRAPSTSSSDLIERIEKTLGASVQSPEDSVPLCETSHPLKQTVEDHILTTPVEPPTERSHQDPALLFPEPLLERTNSSDLCRTKNMAEILTKKRGLDRKTALREMGRQLAAKQFQQRRY